MGAMDAGSLREIALGPGATELRAGGFRILATTLPSRFFIPRHAHRANNLAYTVTGGVAETFDREQVETRPGDVVLKPAGVPHDDRFGDAATTTLQLEWLPDADSNPGPAFDRVLHFRSGDVAALAARLYAELQIQDSATALVAEGLALELLGRIVRSRAPRREAAVPRWLARVRERLHDDPGDGTSIRDLAAEAGVSADHLARRYRQAYGVTAGHDRRRARLEQAAAELMRAHERLSDIALRAGFADQAHFTRAFKRAFGMPPGAYRRGMRPVPDGEL